MTTDLKTYTFTLDQARYKTFDVGHKGNASWMGKVALLSKGLLYSTDGNMLICYKTCGSIDAEHSMVYDGPDVIIRRPDYNLKKNESMVFFLTYRDEVILASAKVIKNANLKGIKTNKDDFFMTFNLSLKRDKHSDHVTSEAMNHILKNTILPTSGDKCEYTALQFDNRLMTKVTNVFGDILRLQCTGYLKPIVVTPLHELTPIGPVGLDHNMVAIVMPRRS